MAENKLVRKLTFWHIWAIGVGSVVGDGIFVLIAQGAQAGGPSSVLAYAVGGLLMMVIMVAISSLAVGMPSAGSLHTWSARILGPSYGTVSGLAYTAMNVIFLGSVAIANGAVSNYFFQWTESAALSAAIWAIILVTLVALVALKGGEFTGRAQLILVATLTFIMILFSIFGAISGKIDTQNYKPFMPFGLMGFWAALGMGIYAYMGPLSLLTAGSEVKKITDLPKAMIWSFITFLIMYSAAMLVMLGLVPFGNYASLESPFTVAAEFAFGGAAGIVMNLAAWIAAFTCLVGEMFAASRLLFGMSEEGVVPKSFSKLNKNNVPSTGIIFSWTVAIILILIGNISVLENFYLKLAMVACELGATSWVISLVASYLYPKRFPDEWNALPWHMPVRKITLPVAFIGWAVIMFALYQSDPGSFIYFLVALVLLVIFYNAYSKKHLNLNIPE